jgi:hypothetical protein
MSEYPEHVIDPQATWPSFVSELQEEILPLYQRHEQTFDSWSIHGRMHICRCVLFAEFMSRYYFRHTTLQPNLEWVRYAIAFHDSGREGSGVDIWEGDSARRCRQYLVHRFPEPVAGTIAGLIPKDGPKPWILEKRIVHDADVLDIMRPYCAPGGRAGFKVDFLRFLGPRDDPAVSKPTIRAALIEEAWELILETEDHKDRLRNSTRYLEYVLGILAGMKDRCRLLYEVFIG